MSFYSKSVFCNVISIIRSVEIKLHFPRRCLHLSQRVKQSKDPEPLFLKPDVQKLLYKLSGFDIDKIYRTKQLRDIGRPKYKLLTDKQLWEVQEDAIRRGLNKLQMPPFMKPADPTDAVLSHDPEIANLSDVRYVFTDITFGLPDRERHIVVRDVDGTLRKASHEERTRMCQIFFPREGKQIHMPKMFTEENLETILAEKRFEYILERACVQFEPDDPEYIRVTHRTYDCIASCNAFEYLYSTRHFGVLTFYLVFYKKTENLLLYFIQEDMIESAADIVHVYHLVHPECPSCELVKENPSLQPVELIKLFVEHEVINKELVQLALQTYVDSQNATRGQLQS